MATTQPAPDRAATTPTTMRAVVADRFGAPEAVLSVRIVPVPVPGEDEVLLRVRSASVNALDWHFTTGTPMIARPSFGIRRPRRTVPGVDVAGTVVAVGPGVTRHRPGDEVYGEVAGGGFAEYVVGPADWLAAKPAALGFDEAATLGVAAQTALQGLRDWGGLRAGYRVLVHGASGGVGTFAVQLAKILGAGHVTAVCSTRNVATARRLGADRVVDYTREDVARLDDRYDLVFDNAGTLPLRTCRRLLTDDGVYVMITAPKGRWLRPLPRLVAGRFSFAGTSRRAVIGRVQERSRADLELLAGLVTDGRLVPEMVDRYPLEGAPEALRRQGEFHARGKSVVVP